MKIWILELAEFLPTEPGARLMRSGQLAEALSAAGHQVVWWTSSFNHSRKSFRCHEHRVQRLNPNYEIQMIHGPGYRRNVSLTRILSHIARARAFLRLASLRKRPDLIFSAVPTLELSEAAVNYGRQFGVPVVIDIVDTWPDSFLTLIPGLLRPLGRLGLYPEFRRIRRICRSAAAIFAVSRQYLAWALTYAGRGQREADGVFPLGYDRELIESGPVDAQFLNVGGILQAHFVACFIGMFGSTYDLATVIDAAGHLHRNGGGRIRFVLAGDGPAANRWKALAAGLPNVIFTGWLSQPQILALLKRANVGLAAYAGGAPQSLGYKPFEYLAGGLPILSSLPGELELLLATERVGYTYEPRDGAELARMILRLADEPENTAAMGRRAAELAKSRFSVRDINRSMMSRLESILATNEP
jgi:glycosyltransferase involved in cell wall biosynthesis